MVRRPNGKKDRQRYKAAREAGQFQPSKHRETKRQAALAMFGHKALTAGRVDSIRHGSQRGHPYFCAHCFALHPIVWLTDGAHHDGALRMFPFCSDNCRDNWRTNNPLR